VAKSKASILVVDDEPAMRLLVTSVLKDEGHEVTAAASGEEALQLIASRHYHMVITDLKMPGMSGVDLLERVKQEDPETAVILLTAFGTVGGAVEAMRKGAVHYLLKPLANPDELRLAVRRVLEERRVADEATTLRQATEAVFPFGEIIAGDSRMQAALDLARTVAPADSTVLVTGETGTGKELIARAVHHWSGRANRAFVAVNCAALAETLLESELFGHERGAFTGAVSARVGLFEYANHGTVFLDEVGDMPMSSQTKLLRVLEYGEIVRVGSNEPIHVDLRLIAATNQSLKDKIAQGSFRLDLFYRLNVITISLPPLRERQGDITLLIDSFTREFSELYHKPISGISADARKVLFRYHWPGNVRELRNCIEHMVVATTDSMLDRNDLPDYVLDQSGELLQEPTLAALAGQPLAEVEKLHLAGTLKLVDGNREKAADLLGIGERTLYRKIEKYKLR
jgi:two-component system response regulator HydG